MLQSLVEQLTLGYQSILRKTFNLSEAIPVKDMEYIDRKVHIFGSGASAIDTMHIVDEKDLTMGCNITLALLEKWDFGFVERLEANEFGRLQMQVLMERKFGILLLKNNYPTSFNKKPKNIKLLKSKHEISLLRECQVISGRNDIDHLVELILDDSNNVLRQYASSILTMMIFAQRMGIKKMVLHGVDFGGVCFYERHPFTQFNFRKFQDSKTVIHQTDSYNIPFSLVLKSVIDKMKKDGITVVHAREIS